MELAVAVERLLQAHASQLQQQLQEQELHGKKVLEGVMQRMEKRFALSSRSSPSQVPTPSSQTPKAGRRRGAQTVSRRPETSESGEQRQSWSWGRAARIREFIMDMDVLSGVLVIANTIFMVFEMEFAMIALVRGEEKPVWIWWGGLVFAIFFCIEVAARVCIERHHFIFGTNWKWNVFDTVLVVFQVVDTVTTHANNASFIRVLRTLRVIRAAKILRVLRVVRELRLILAAIASAVTEMFWRMLLLFVVVLFFSMGAQELVFASVQDRSPADLHEHLFQYYGSLHDTTLTLFMAITGGAEWQRLAEPLAHLSKAYLLYYSVYVAFLTLVVFNIITALFVESHNNTAALECELAIKQQLESDDSVVNQVRRRIDALSTSSCGTITRSEFENVLQDPEFKAAAALAEAEEQGLLQLFECEEHGEVTVDELVYALMRLKEKVKAADMAAHENKRILSKISALKHFVEENFAILRERLGETFDPETPEE